MFGSLDLPRWSAPRWSAMWSAPRWSAPVAVCPRNNRAREGVLVIVIDIVLFVRSLDIRSKKCYSWVYSHQRLE